MGKPFLERLAVMSGVLDRKWNASLYFSAEKRPHRTPDAAFV
ncbi:MAG: hypothetical protein Q7J42_02725 [Sulfuritalea sp.]|nr:hypothetical protein [Sulfuritalea sp.]